MRRNRNPAVVTLGAAAFVLLSAWPVPGHSQDASGTAAPAAAPLNPSAVPGIPTDERRVEAAIREIDRLVGEAMAKTGTPGVAVAVVHKGRTVFARGYGVREVGKPETVDANTVFQLASVSKPIGATVVAREVGDGTVGWDTPVVAHLPGFALADPYVTEHLTIADMYAHRSGLPAYAGDVLDDIGYDQQQVFERLRYLPLTPFRIVYNYTNFGMTAAAEAVAAAAGTDWATLSEENIYRPLGMTSTSSRFSDFQARPNRAVGHVKVEGGGFEAKYVRQPDSMSPAGGVSSSVTDVAAWLAMVLNDGKAPDGTPVVDAEALRMALTPHIRAVPGNPPPSRIDQRQTFYGYGFDIGNDASGRVRINHSGGFALGAGTRMELIPNLELGIIVLTNAAGNGTAEAVASEFADLAEFGSIQAEWLAGFQRALAAGLTDPVGSLVGEARPASPAPASPPAAYVGTYSNDFIGPVTITESGGGLVLTVGPRDMQFPLTHWDGQVFTMIPTGENAPDGSISKVTFELSDGVASAVTVEFFDRDGLGTLRR